ncbi:MAG: FlgD immunoglobulin-like domain containing protein [Candidatus Kapabacteria bacterium]|jgi:hypothetical protein|nr:FlgD immunoglobulin-like domain containing protein [Candidatus Kapabacteria bacterium]
MLKLIFLLIFFLLSSNIQAISRFDDGSVNTILKKPTVQTPLQIMQESANKRNDESELHKDEVFTPEQDSLFKKYITLQLPINVILRNNLVFTDDLWNIEKRLSEGTPWQIALQNIRSIPPEFYNPSPVDVVHRHVQIASAFEVPNLRTYDPFHGVRFDAEAVARFFGIMEDVSPEITYSIDYTAHVEVVVYSISSSVVATLFKGLQTPGTYTYTWNGRNQDGRPMPPGDYIAEVRIGNEKYIRKRIVLK